MAAFSSCWLINTDIHLARGEEGLRYGDTGPCLFRPEDVTGPRNRFVIVRRNGDAIGCGAIRLLEPKAAEVKRVYVVSEARGQGAGGQLISELERLALDLGYDTLRLETGIKQPEAIRLYERCGFNCIPCWGAHASDPLSVCFEKVLIPKGNHE